MTPKVPRWSYGIVVGMALWVVYFAVIAFVWEPGGTDYVFIAAAAWIVQVGSTYQDTSSWPERLAERADRRKWLLGTAIPYIGLFVSAWYLYNRIFGWR